MYGRYVLTITSHILTLHHVTLQAWGCITIHTKCLTCIHRDAWTYICHIWKYWHLPFKNDQFTDILHVLLTKYEHHIPNTVHIAKMLKGQTDPSFAYICQNTTNCYFYFMLLPNMGQIEICPPNWAYMHYLSDLSIWFYKCAWSWENAWSHTNS